MTADESPLSRAVQGVTLSCAALPGLRRFAAGEGDKPKRAQLRGWLKALLADYDRRGVEVERARTERAELKRENESLYKQRETFADAVAELGDERDELRTRLRQARCERDAAQRGRVDAALTCAELRVERDRLREAAEHRPDYILLRLAGGQPEVLTVSVWDETDPTPAGGITATVEGYRAGTVTGRAECSDGSGDQ